MARILTEETSLSRRRHGLHRESRLLTRLWPWEAGLVALLLLAGLLVWLRQARTSLLWAGAAAAILPVGHWFKIRQNAREGDSLQAGASGEASTARRLNDQLDQTHYLFNDLLLRHGFRTAQVDHLVVCPRGLFVIETKNWRGEVTGRGDDPTWQQVKRPGEPPIRLKSPILQVRRQAAVVAQLLKSAGLDWPDVVPVVAFASAKTRVKIEDPGLPVVHLDGLSAAVAGHTGRTYTPAEVDRTVALLLKRMAA